MITANDAQQYVGKFVTVTKTDKTTVTGQATGLSSYGMLTVIDSIVIIPGGGGPLAPSGLAPVKIPFAEIESISEAGGMNIAGMNIDWKADVPLGIVAALAFFMGQWYARNYGK